MRRAANHNQPSSRSRPPWPVPTRLALFCLVLLVGLGVTKLNADGPLNPQRSAAQLIGPDFRRARVAAEDLLAAKPYVALPAVLEARSAASSSSARVRCDKVIETLLETVISELTARLPGDPYQSPLGLGGPGGALLAHHVTYAPSKPKDPLLADLSPEELQKRSSQAREMLLKLGPPIVYYLTKTPPLRSIEQQRVLYALSRKIARAALDKVAGQSEAEAKAWLQGFGSNGELMEQTLVLGSRDERAKVRTLFREQRDQILNGALKKLASKSYAERRLAEDTLFRMRNLAYQRVFQMGQAPKTKSPQKGSKATQTKKPEASSQALRVQAARLAQRLRFGISRKLYEKLGHLLKGYDRQDFRERRKMVLEIERLGGLDGIPALRSIMRQEKSDEVRVLAALSLARLGDPVGIVQLQREGLPGKVSIPKSDLIAIYMDQGLRYLTIRQFRKAEVEFRRVLELAAGNETALYNLACTYSLWGQLSKALDHLEKAVEQGFDDLSHIENDPDLNPLHNQPRFLALLKALARKKEGAQ